MIHPHTMICLPLLSIAFVGSVSVGAESYTDDAAFDAKVRPYLTRYCVECHGEKRQENEFRVDSLARDIKRPDQAVAWRDVMSQIANQVMPPDDAKARPSDDESIAVIGWIEASVRRAEVALRANGGRAVLRQLNNTEFRNALCDLLHLPSEAIERIASRHALPPDIVDQGYDNHGSVQVISAMQLEKLADFVDDVLERALVIGERPQPLFYEMSPGRVMLRKFEARFQKDWHALESKRTILASQERWLAAKQQLDAEGPRPVLLLPHPDSNPKILGFDRLEKQYGIPREVLERVARGQPGFSGATPKTFGNDFHTGSALSYSSSLNIKSPGLYRIVARLGVAGEYREPQTVRMMWDLEGGKGDWRPERILWQVDTPLEKIRDSRYEAVVYFEPGTKYSWVSEGLTMRQEWMRHGDAHGYVYLDSYTVEGPLLDSWPPRAYREIYYDGPAAPGDLKYAAAIIERFTARALRRPLDDRDRRRFADVVAKLAASGLEIDDVIRTGLRHLLTSPGFPLIDEPKPRDADEAAYEIDDFALATRLSTCLWRSVPDSELLQLAKDGRLSHPQVLSAQVERLLADRRSERFVNDFTDMWLRLGELDTRTPDETQFPHFDEHLQRSMRSEVRAFFRELLDRDLDVLNFLDSDFAMLNERLAVHYGIPGVKGDELRRVPLDRPQHHRGGLMGMAAILMRYATDVRTSPVSRGAFLLDKLLGSPPPLPPLNVPPLEKVPETIDGRPITLAEKMALHRKDAKCAHCHKQIDPLGMAFEHYDAVGQWRDDQGTPGLWGAPRQIGPLVMAADRMPRTETPFNGPDELLTVIRRERGNDVAVSVTENLLTYALGRPLDFTDRPLVEQIVSQLRERRGGLQTLVQLVVASDAFRRK